MSHENKKSLYVSPVKNRDIIINTFSRELNRHKKNDLSSDSSSDNDNDNAEQIKKVENNINKSNEKLILNNKTIKKTYKKKLGRQKNEDITEEINNLPICGQIILDDSEIPNFSKIAIDTIIRDDIEYPKFTLGFSHWIHASKNKTHKFDNYKGKKRVYQVVNSYETYVDDYEESISIVSKTFFNLSESVNILSRAFYKLWEIFYFFDIIDIEEKEFVSAHLAEGPGSFIQATMHYRSMYAKKHSKNDNYHAITIHGENEDNSLELEKEFVDFYSKEKPQRVFIHKTYSKKISRAIKNKDNGDITKTKTVENFKKDITKKVNLVTGDGGFDWDNENIQEQECAILIYSQIVAAINIQKKGGHFILKMFEMFTNLSVKFILLLKYFYNDVYIIKPFTSRESNSERYVICKNFKFSEKDIETISKSMLLSLDTIDVYKNDKLYFLYDIFPSINIPDKLTLNIVSINKQITNQQFCVINQMMEYLDESNFHGEKYMKYKERQINSTKYWINIFLSNNSDNNKAKKILDQSLKIHIKEYDNYKANLVGYNVKK